jgi:hypothetical protein
MGIWDGSSSIVSNAHVRFAGETYTDFVHPSSPEYPMNETITDLSSLPGTPLYHNGTSWEYRFFNRNPEHQYTDYVLSGRKIQATTTCQQLITRGNVVDPDNATMYIEAKQTEDEEYWKYKLPQKAGGAITW